MRFQLEVFHLWLRQQFCRLFGHRYQYIGLFGWSFLCERCLMPGGDDWPFDIKDSIEPYRAHGGWPFI